METKSHSESKDLKIYHFIFNFVLFVFPFYGDLIVWLAGDYLCFAVSFFLLIENKWRTFSIAKMNKSEFHAILCVLAQSISWIAAYSFDFYKHRRSSINHVHSISIFWFFWALRIYNVNLVDVFVLSLVTSSLSGWNGCASPPQIR